MERDLPSLPAPTKARPVVFFDGSCPLCRREIAHYRRIDRTAQLHWVDASNDADTLAIHGLTRESAMAELHVLDADGHWQRGVDAFLVIWAHLPAYRWLARLVAVFGLRSPLSSVYRRFAAWRLRRRCGAHGCATGQHPGSLTPTKEDLS